MKTLKSLRDIPGKHPLVGDGTLMLLVAGSALFVQRAYWVLPPPPLNAPLTITLALLAIIPLAWRRRFLMAALIPVTATMVALDALNVTANLSPIASITAVFSAAAYGGHRRNLACIGSIVTFNGGLMYSLMSRGNAAFLSGATLFNVAGLVWILATFVATWWFGNTLRMGRERTSRLRDIRVLGIQAGGTRRFLKRYHEKALASLRLVEASSRQVAVELFRLRSLLRDERQVEPNPSTNAATSRAE